MAPRIKLNGLEPFTIQEYVITLNYISMPFSFLKSFIAYPSVILET